MSAEGRGQPPDTHRTRPGQRPDKTGTEQTDDGKWKMPGKRKGEVALARYFETEVVRY